MAHHDLPPPLSESAVRALRVNDTVTLQGTLFGIRDANQIALFDKGRETRFDMRGHAAIHTAPNVRKVPPSRLRTAMSRWSSFCCISEQRSTLEIKRNRRR